MKKRKRRKSADASASPPSICATKDPGEGWYEEGKPVRPQVTGADGTTESVQTLTSPSSDKVVTVNDFLNWSATNSGLHFKRTYKYKKGRMRSGRAVVLSPDAAEMVARSPDNGAPQTRPAKRIRTSWKLASACSITCGATHRSTSRKRPKRRKLGGDEVHLPISAPTPLKLTKYVSESTSAGSSPGVDTKRALADPRRVPFIVSSFNTPLRKVSSEGCALSKLPRTSIQKTPSSNRISKSTKSTPATNVPNVTPLKLERIISSKPPQSQRYGLTTKSEKWLRLNSGLVAPRNYKTTRVWIPVFLFCPLLGRRYSFQQHLRRPLFRFNSRRTVNLAGTRCRIRRPLQKGSITDWPHTWID